MTGQACGPRPSCSTGRRRSGNGGEQAERDRRAARAAESARRAEVARRQRLAALAAEGDRAWARVAARIAEKKPSGYDVAVDLLVDLREVMRPGRLRVSAGGAAARARPQGDVRRAARARRAVMGAPFSSSEAELAALRAENARLRRLLDLTRRAGAPARGRRRPDCSSTAPVR